MSNLRYRYQTIEIGNTDIHLRTLKDKQQFEDINGVAEALGISSATWPFFGVIWPSSEVLAQYMHEYALDGKRILEVGCGMALTSLMLNNMNADITATDYHPEVEQFLIDNALLNNAEIIPFIRTAWEDEITELGLFDVIIGSDLLYERDHASLLSEFINQHAKADCHVILTDPGRGHKGQLRKCMDELGYHYHLGEPVNPDQLSSPYKGQILHFTR